MKCYALALDLINDARLIEEYENWHRKENAWPEVQQSIAESGIRSMRIYRTGNRLFMVIETDDSFSFAAKSRQDSENKKVQEWEALMWKYQKPLPWADEGEKWVVMDLIFSLQANEAPQPVG